MPITLLYTSLLALWLLALSWRVIQRRQAGINLGDGGDADMQRRIRGHGNFIEYVPTALLLIALLEYQGLHALAVHALGLTLLVARLLHGYALSFTDKFFLGRFWGTALTLGVLLVGALLGLWQALTAA